ncbi:MAG: glycosyltransferase family 39 protein [Candidatus Sumerlaeota bacterium]
MRNYRMYVGGLLALVLVLHIGFITRHTLFTLEFITIRAINADYLPMIRERIGRNHMPGYFIVLKALTQLFGQGAFVLRLPSALGSIGGVLATWRLGVWMFGRRTGLMVLAMLAIHQIGITIAHDARMYAWLFCASSLVLWATIAWWESGRKRYLWLLFCGGLFGMFSHMLYLLIPGILLLYALIHHRRLRMRGWSSVAVAFTPALLMLPIIAWWTRVQDKVGRSQWKAPEFTEGLRQLKMTFLGDYHYLDFDPLQGVEILLILICGYVTLRLFFAKASPEKPFWRYVDLLWLWCLLPTLGIILVAVKSHHQMVESFRYYIMTLSATPILLTGAWVGLKERGHPKGAKVFVGAVLAMLALNSASYLAQPGEGLRRVVKEIGRDYRQGDLIVTSRQMSRDIAVPYYLDASIIPHGLPDKHWPMEKIDLWFRETTKGYERVWVIFYDNKFAEDPLAIYLARHEGDFKPLRPVFHYGESHMGLYALPPGE